jgi:hypothetical protein
VKQQAEAFAQDVSRMQEAMDVAVLQREAAEKRATDLQVRPDAHDRRHHSIPNASCLHDRLRLRLDR